MNELKPILSQYNVMLNEIYENTDWDDTRYVGAVYRKGDPKKDLNTLEYELKLYKDHVEIDFDLVTDSKCIFHQETDYSDLPALASLIGENYNK